MVCNHHQSFRITDGQSPPNSFAFFYNEENRMLSFLQENGPKEGHQAAPEESLYQPLPHSTASAESRRDSDNMFSCGLTQSIDLGCALYLLSANPTQTSAMGLSHLLQSSVSHPIQSLGSGQQHDAVAQYSCSHGTKDKPAGLVLVPDANQTNINCNGMSQGALDGLLESEATPTLPIWWE